MKKRMLAAALVMIMLLGLMPVGMAAGAPQITKQPKAQTVLAGGSCTFSAKASNANGITWRFYNEATGDDMPFTYAADHFAGLSVSGKNRHDLNLSNIPAEMNGVLVYCRYGNDSGRADTQKVKLTVVSEEPAEEEPAAGSYVPADGEKLITAIGCYIQHVNDGGKAQGEKLQSINFTDSYKNPVTGKTCEGGTLNCKVTADVPRNAKIAYWVINGARYDFDMPVKSILVEDLTWSMQIEVVYDDDLSETHLSDAEAVAKATGVKLQVDSINAKMSLVNEKKKPDGGYFYHFDFTNHYHNAASGALEDGGQVDLKVVANVPTAHIVTYWKMNEAKLNFNSHVSWFTVDNLSESMVYQPVFRDNSTPVPSYSIKCDGCVFSGGGYNRAKSGTVPYGTKITIYPLGNSYSGYWTGSHNTGTVSNASIGKTVKSDCYFFWHAEIN